MKYSCFNSIIPLTSQTNLLYNSFSDSFMVVKADMKQMIEKDCNGLSEKIPNLNAQLIQGGFYVPDELNEFEQLKELSQKIVQNKSEYFVIVNPTLACNFKCWYCYENHLPGSRMSKNILNRLYFLFDNIVKETPNLQSFPVAFFGGEPLIYFKSIVMPLIEYHENLCRKNNLSSHISFTSNGGLITSEMISKLAEYNRVSFQITLDGAEEEHDKVRFSAPHIGSYRVIIRNIKALLASRIFVRVRINYTINNLKSLKNIVDDVRDISMEARSYLKFDFHWVWQEKDLSYELSGIREIVDYFAENGFTVIFNEVDLLRNSCYADRKNTVVVNYNGDLYKCTARDFIPENRDGYLDETGHIVWLKPEDYRYSLRFKNEKCHTCRIAPLCAGGCTNYMMKKDKDKKAYCLYERENRIDELILDRFDMYIRKGCTNG